MQALFDMDMSQNDSEERLESFCLNFNPSSKVLPFFQFLIICVKKKRKEIDTLIKQYSSNWKISRISCVDRNVMRIAVYEMLHCEDIPSKVSINEAIEIGKEFGAEDSGSFINGILDSIRIMLENNNNNKE